MKNTPNLFEQLSGLLTDGIGGDYKSVLSKGMNYYEKRRQESFNEFHQHLLAGTATKEKIEYEKMFKITEDQYYALLSASINDEERQKAHIYANVYRNILESKIKKENYIRYIKLAKELPYSALELLPHIYIYNTFHTKYKSFIKYFQELNKTKRYEINLFAHHDIFTKSSLTFNDLDFGIKNIVFFNEIVSIFFKEEELIPSKYNIELWKENIVLILSNDPCGEGHEVDFVKNILNENSIKSDIMIYQPIDKKVYSHIICVVNDNTNPNNLPNLDEISTNTQIIKVAISQNFKNQHMVHKNVLDLNKIEHIDKLKKTFSE